MLEGIAETGSQTGVDPGSNPGSDNWEQLTPAPAANVMHTVGDMVFRNNANENARLVVSETAGLALNVGESPKETYSSRQFTYTLNGTNGNVINTPGSIAAVTYNITTKNQRATNYVIDGSDRDGDINWEYDGTIRVNIGDTIVFNNTNTHSAHPMAIRVANGGASVSTGTYSGEGTATVTWVTTGVTAGTYYYQCTNHAGMVGQIIVESTENRQGSAGANGTMEVCRGKQYTITLDGLTNGLTYNLFSAAAPQAGTTNAITSAEGNSAPSGTAYSGSAVTFTFTPNETTPDTVYLSSASNTSDQVAITVNDLAYVPGWATPAPSNQLVLDDSDGTHTFTINSNNQSTNLQWTLPAIAPATNDKIMQVSTTGNITYVDKPQGYIEATGWWTNRRNMNSNTAYGAAASTWTRARLTTEEWDDGNLGTVSGDQLTVANAGTYLIKFHASGNYFNGYVARLQNVTTGTTLAGSQTAYSTQYYTHTIPIEGYWYGTLNANDVIAVDFAIQSAYTAGYEYNYWTNMVQTFETGIMLHKITT